MPDTDVRGRAGDEDRNAAVPSEDSSRLQDQCLLDQRLWDHPYRLVTIIVQFAGVQAAKALSTVEVADGPKSTNNWTAHIEGSNYQPNVYVVIRSAWDNYTGAITTHTDENGKIDLFMSCKVIPLPSNHRFVVQAYYTDEEGKRTSTSKPFEIEWTSPDYGPMATPATTETPAKRPVPRY
jgi:hypothetical protein